MHTNLYMQDSSPGHGAADTLHSRCLMEADLQHHCGAHQAPFKQAHAPQLEAHYRRRACKHRPAARAIAGLRAAC